MYLCVGVCHKFRKPDPESMKEGKKCDDSQNYIAAKFDKIVECNVHFQLPLVSTSGFIMLYTIGFSQINHAD